MTRPRDVVLTWVDAFNRTKVEILLESGTWAALEWSGGGTWRGEFAGRMV
jgi:hypothetical protein